MTAEDEDLAYLRRLLGGDGLSGPGDDAALVRLHGPVLATIDPVVEGVHFDAGTAPARVARKLVHRSFSDLAAMGALPAAVLVSCCFTRAWDTRRRRALYRAIAAATGKHGARWVGGDLATTKGATVLTLCALGRARRIVTRAGLEPGHLLGVTGPLGASRRSGWHLDFVPRLAEGARLAERHKVSAMIDVSDGLLLDLARLCAASGGYGAELDAAKIPRRRGASLSEALGDGEDHELLFGIPAARASGLRRDLELPAIARTPIGRVTKRAGLWLCHDDGTRTRLAPRGWQHALA